MNSSVVTRLTAITTAVLGVLLVTAGQALALNPPPDQGHGAPTRHVPTMATAHVASTGWDNPIQWVVLAAALLVAAAVGAGLMRLADRRSQHGQLA
jgi:hypothetical protein